MIVYAIDARGDKFRKTVVLGEYNKQMTIEFGGPMIYNAQDLLKEYPFFVDFCIDSAGENHGGFGTGPVVIKKYDINKIIEQLVMD